MIDHRNTREVTLRFYGVDLELRTMLSAEPLMDNFWGVKLPYPIPGPGAKVTVTGSLKFDSLDLSTPTIQSRARDRRQVAEGKVSLRHRPQGESRA